jgi:hypothetical protein
MIFPESRRRRLSGSDIQLGNAWQAQAFELTEAPDFQGLFFTK